MIERQVKSSVVVAAQYIVKPPRSSQSGFAWHYDSQWLPDGTQHSPYISVSLQPCIAIRLTLQ